MNKLKMRRQPPTIHITPYCHVLKNILLDIYRFVKYFVRCIQLCCYNIAYTFIPPEGKSLLLTHPPIVLFRLMKCFGFDCLCCVYVLDCTGMYFVRYQGFCVRIGILPLPHSAASEAKRSVQHIGLIRTIKDNIFEPKIKGLFKK